MEKVNGVPRRYRSFLCGVPFTLSIHSFLMVEPSLWSSLVLFCLVLNLIRSSPYSVEPISLSSPSRELSSFFRLSKSISLSLQWYTIDSILMVKPIFVANNSLSYKMPYSKQAQGFPTLDKTHIKRPVCAVKYKKKSFFKIKFLIAYLLE